MGVALWSSSSQHLPKPRDSLRMAATSVLSTIKDLINDDVFVEKTQELSRLFYSNSDLTIDLYVYLAWGTAIAAVLLLMFLLFGDESKLGISSGYGSALSKSYDTDDAIFLHIGEDPTTRFKMRTRLLLLETYLPRSQQT